MITAESNIAGHLESRGGLYSNALKCTGFGWGHRGHIIYAVAVYNTIRHRTHAPVGAAANTIGVAEEPHQLISASALSSPYRLTGLTGVVGGGVSRLNGDDGIAFSDSSAHSLSFWLSRGGRGGFFGALWLARHCYHSTPGVPSKHVLLPRAEVRRAQVPRGSKFLCRLGGGPQRGCTSLRVA